MEVVILKPDYHESQRCCDFEEFLGCIKRIGASSFCLSLLFSLSLLLHPAWYYYELLYDCWFYVLLFVFITIFATAEHEHST